MPWVDLRFEGAPAEPLLPIVTVGGREADTLPSGLLHEGATSILDDSLIMGILKYRREIKVAASCGAETQKVGSTAGCQ